MLFALKNKSKSACIGPGIYFGLACVGIGKSLNKWLSF